MLQIPIGSGHLILGEPLACLPSSTKNKIKKKLFIVDTITKSNSLHMYHVRERPVLVNLGGLLDHHAVGGHHA